ncbi:Rrf2 family transcriptional regulator [Paraburkholderia terrae]|uniref:Rrf2 family transcriptional regulator n=1 Tax=Paraburkholderia terrae TaxID=311230 RepID=A0A2I8F4S2_9BURK|nr:Rrf2 family transcriptional regulator [Paraburkholderia terrae]AUT66710.1 Rrf2 family transcriptional regulator [Paraburkholderia terrae]
MIDLRFSTAFQMVLSVALADHDGFRCTSKMLADGLGANPSFVRQLLVPLGRDGIIAASIGKGGGLHLARAAASITLREIYASITGEKRFLHARPSAPPRCRVSANIEPLFEKVAADADKALLESLQRRNVAEVLSELLRLDKVRVARGGAKIVPEREYILEE